MIYYVVSRRHRYTMADYLGSWGQPLSPRVRVVPYGALPGNASLPAGTYVFSDLERLTAAQRPLVASLCAQLTAAGSAVVNDPVRSLRRHQLLTCLHARGDNRFAAFPVTDLGRPFRYPVFVRVRPRRLC